MSTVFILRELVMVLAMAFTLVLWARIPVPRRRLFRLAGLLCMVGLAVELFGFGVRASQRNWGVHYNVYVLLEFILVLTMLYDQRPRWRRVLLPAFVIGSGGMAWSTWLHGGVNTLLTEGAVVIALVLALLIVAFLVELARQSEQVLQRVPVFWLFMGLLVYFGGLLPVVGLVRVLYVQFPELAARLWTILPVLTVVRYLLAAQACRLEARLNDR